MHTGHLLVNLSFASKHFQEHPKDEQKRRTLLDAWKKDNKFQESATTFILSDNNGLADIMRGPDTTHEVLW